MYDALSYCYPLPFQLNSSTQLPRRSPFSCVLDMADEAEVTEQNRLDFVKKARYFRSNALAIIEKMLFLNDSCQGRAKRLVDEILHSIFFLGMINSLQILPERLVKESNRFEEVKEQFPRPFDLCSSQIPRRSPFSCVLDMIVLLSEGPEKEDEIIKWLQEIIKPLEQNHLVPYTICVSQITNNPNSACRYYGVSMSRMPPDVCRIMIAASCLSEYWDSYVAGAVMTYLPNDTKHPDFDGTIILPEQVTCETFKLFKVGKVYMPPCRNCQNMFGLTEIDTDTHLAEGASAESQIAARSSLTCSTSNTPPLPPPDTDRPKKFAYGNCAEVESVSNLFKKDTEVREQARPTSEKATDDSRKTAAERVMADLLEWLEKKRFTWDTTFYNPQL